MITDALLAILNTLIGWLVDLLPEWELEMPAGLNWAVGVSKYWNDFFPVTEILTCLTAGFALVAGMQTVKWSIKVIDWIADVLP